MKAPDAGAPLALRNPQCWVAGMWLGIALFDATQTVFVMRAEGMHHFWVRLFFYRLLSWLPWALATPLVLELRRRRPLAWRAGAGVWGLHLAACIGIGLVEATLQAALEAWTNPWARPGGPGPFTQIWQQHFLGGLVAMLVLYGTILLAGLGLDSRERLARQQAETARLNEQLAKAQLDALRRQIEPHFLFNALNAVAGLVREQRNDAAVRVIAGISDLLRRVLDDSGRHWVSLGEELAFLHKYLDIQKMRFGERLQVEVEVADELLRLRVPGLILQVLAENAFKHGLSRRAQGGLIRIAAQRRPDRTLALSVYNDGPPLPERTAATAAATTAATTAATAGIGLANAAERLRSLYGERFELGLHNCGQGVEVRILLPPEPA